MPKKPVYDWKAIAQRFITGGETLEELRADYGMALSTIGERSSKEEWLNQRESYRQGIAAESQKRAAKQSILERAGFDAVTERSADVTVALIMRELGRVYQENGNPDPSELTECMKAVKLAQDIKYRALGIAPPKQVIEQVITHSPAQLTRDEIAAEIEAMRIKLPAEVHAGNGHAKA